jgi:hypothetical protein
MLLQGSEYLHNIEATSIERQVGSFHQHKVMTGGGIRHDITY